jgi:TonB-linked SusC/RagA family outer membrane protein
MFLVAICHTAVFAQNNQVTGRVTGADGTPVAGASITVSGTTTGTTTDESGNFALTAPENASLLVSYVGFTDQVVALNGRTAITVQLVAGVSSGLDEVVVTGYTAQRKRDIVGSVAVVDTRALKSIPSSSAMQALQGQASGVDVTNNGSPGAPSLIFIRGVGNFNATPLVLIDGVQGNINDVPTNDVESIQVLKDAGAASIYGTRAANGVIIITTKRGRSGAPVITYDSYYNWQIPHKGSELNMLSSQQWADLFKTINPSSGLFINGQLPDYLWRGPTGQGVANEGDPAVNPALYKFDPRNRAQNYLITKVNKNGQGGDMYDAIFNPALMMNHTLSASGGSDRANYLLSVGYLNHQGTLQNTYLKRYNMRVNTMFKLRDNIRIGENVNISYTDNPQAPVNGNFGPIQQAINQLPIFPVYDIAGNYAGPITGPGSFGLGDWGNSKADVELTDNNRARNYSAIGNLYAEVDFLRHFTARTSLGVSATNFYRQDYQYNKYWTASGGGNNFLTESSGFSSTLQWTNTLAYRNTFGKHNLSVLAGSESVENKFRSQSAVGENFLSDDYRFLVIDAAQTRRLPNSGLINPAGDDALFSLFSKVDYGYNDKYLLSLTVRRDGFSAFGPEKKYGVFPAIAAGWRISQEDFMKGIGFINDLKIRGSYGVTGFKEGINPANAYTTFSQNRRFSYYDINGTGNSSVLGFYPLQNGNAFTSWEEDKITNVGFDATVLNNKIDVSIDYYIKKSEGLLRVRQVPYTAGEARSPSINLGDIENKGFDITAAYRGRVSKDFGYNVRVNFTTYKSKVISLADPGGYYDEGIVRIQEGYPMGSFFGYKVVGVFQDSSEISKNPLQSDAAPGRYRYQDVDGNDTINANDRTHFGNPNPKFTMGINLGANYKKFDISAILYTSQGNDIFNNQLEYIGSFERGIGNQNTRVLNAWTPNNKGSMIKKNEAGRNFSNSGVNNSDWLEDGSFIRLRSLQFGYNLESARMRANGISRIRFSIMAVNLFTITNYSGLDPEVAGTGSVFRGQDAGAYVQEKGISFGLNVGF